MKAVLLSADSYVFAYAVPDVVADNLRRYCLEFHDDWLENSPHAAKYRESGNFTEVDFIEYLNTWLFPDEPSFLIENLGFCDDGVFPPEYRSCEWFNF